MEDKDTVRSEKVFIVFAAVDDFLYLTEEDLVLLSLDHLRSVPHVAANTLQPIQVLLVLDLMLDRYIHVLGHAKTYTLKYSNTLKWTMQSFYGKLHIVSTQMYWN